MQHTVLRLPFEGAWLTFWGGDNPEQNIHHATYLQKYAFDFIQVDENGKFFRTDGKTNDDYYSFGQSILAPGDGEVIEAIDGMRDNLPGTSNHYMAMGNFVLIKHADHEYSLLAHLKQGSVCVKAGQQIKSGEKIGECGNSGNSSDPHLHFHLQDSDVISKFDENYKQVDVASGLKVSFSNIEIIKGKDKEIKDPYSPVKGDIVLPLTREDSQQGQA